MSCYDVFNGDADGICALLQLRLVEPRTAELITGVKRDINLVERVPLIEPVDIVVLDVSLDSNRAAVERQLALGSRVFYCDHHYAGESLLSDPAFTGLIDTSPSQCTSLLIDQYLQGRFRHWAIVAAYGDNLSREADALADSVGLGRDQAAALRSLGVCINYNGYGAALEDLHMHPADLYRALQVWSDPLQLIADDPEFWQVLRTGYATDLALAMKAPTLLDVPSARVVHLPDEPWARRVSGVFGNALANAEPSRACAVLTANQPGFFQISIRAPLADRNGADLLARQFPTGGGRAGAAGINALPVEQLDDFMVAMATHWA